MDHKDREITMQNYEYLLSKSHNGQSNNRATGDARRIYVDKSPAYMFHRMVPARITQVLGHHNVFLVFLLRNPMLRMLSGYFHLLLKGGLGSTRFHSSTRTRSTGIRAFRALRKSLPMVQRSLPDLAVNELTSDENIRADLDAQIFSETYAILNCYWGSKVDLLTNGCQTPINQLLNFTECLRVTDAPWLPIPLTELASTHMQNLHSKGHLSGKKQDNIMLRGLYSDQIQNFFCHGFGTYQMFFASNNMLSAHPDEVMWNLTRKVRHFFRIPDHQKSIHKFPEISAQWKNSKRESIYPSKGASDLVSYIYSQECARLGHILWKYKIPRSQVHTILQECAFPRI